MPTQHVAVPKNPVTLRAVWKVKKAREMSKQAGGGWRAERRDAVWTVPLMPPCLRRS